MNRAARRLALFEDRSDYAAFLAVLRDAQQLTPLRILSYVVMPNHWHLVVWPRTDEDLPRFMAWMTATHARRWHLQHASVGQGTIYQGRYKAIPIREDHHFLVVSRYVERNPVKAGLSPAAEKWPWGSAFESWDEERPALHEWPIPRPEGWREHVNRPESPGEFDRLRLSIRSGSPFGPSEWQQATAESLNWWHGLRLRGRPAGIASGKN